MDPTKNTSSPIQKFWGLFIVAFLLVAITITFTLSQKQQNSVGARAAEVPITPNPLVLTTSLDSTIRVNWPAPITPQPTPLTSLTPTLPPLSPYTKQIFSVWDHDPNNPNNDILVSTKVLGNTSSVADANGLQGNHQYTIRIEGLRASDGQKEAYLANYASTALQPPMANAAFFENFMDTAPMEVKSDYLDVRTLANEGIQPDSLHEERMLFMPNERHFHTEMIGGVQRSELIVRPRVPFNFASRTGTFQTEVDMAPVQNDNQGVWWEIHLSKDIPGSGRAFGSGNGNEFQNGITFSIARPQNRSDQPGDITNTSMNKALISVNINNTKTEYEGTVRQATGANVRMPVIIKMTDDPTHTPRNKAEMWINGVKVAETPWLNLGYTTGFWTLAHRHFYTSRNFDFQIPNQLVHWDTIQYDGPAGSINPYMKTYIQPGCGKIVNYDIHSYNNGGIKQCPKLSFTSGHSTMPLNVDPADFSKGIRAARLIFGVTHGQANNYTFQINTAPATTVPYFDNSEYDPDPATVLIHHDLTSAELTTLHSGANQIIFNGNQNLTVTQVELEVEYSQPRIIANPSTTNPPVMIGATTNAFRFHHDPSNPNASETATTTLFSAGATGSVGWHADVFMDSNDHDVDGNPVNDWLHVSSTDGTLTNSPANIGGAGFTTLTLTADFSRLRTDCNTTVCINKIHQDDGNDGTVGVIRIRRADDPMMMNHMPVYIAVMVVNDGQTAAHDKDDHLLTTFTGLNSSFNRCAIPNYCAITPTQFPTITPTIDIRRADVNHDGAVTVQDFNIYRNQLNHQCTAGMTNCADVDCSGAVNITDATTIQGQMGRPVPTQAPVCDYLLTPTPGRFGAINTGKSVNQMQRGSGSYEIAKDNGKMSYPSSQ